MRNKLLALQQAIYNFYSNQQAEYDLTYFPRIYFFEINGLFDIRYYGPGYDDDPLLPSRTLNEDYNFGFCALLDLLSDQENANLLIALSFEGPDEGANGLNRWDFRRITNSAAFFTNLKQFSVRLTDPGDHNLSLISDGALMDNGQMGRLLKQMPILQELSIPSTPDSSFFTVNDHPLQKLVVQASYGTQNFIRLLSESMSFPYLHSLDYTDMLTPYDEINPEEYTSLEDYVRLLKSAAFRSVKQFKLRNSLLTKSQLETLRNNTNVSILSIENRRVYK